MSRRTVIVTCLLLPLALHAQERPLKQPMFSDLRVTNTISKSYGDTTLTFHVDALDADDIKPQFNKRYHWFNHGEIKVTQGSFTGKLLHGPYEKFNSDGVLLEKGEFKAGLKDGTWLSWHPNGTIFQRYDWRQGAKNGKFAEYHNNGVVHKTGTYKSDKLEGKVFYYNQHGLLLTEERYKSGNIVKAKEKKIPEKRIEQPEQRITTDSAAAPTRKKFRLFKKKEAGNETINPEKRSKPGKPEKTKNKIKQEDPQLQPAEEKKKKERKKKDKPSDPSNQSQSGQQ